MDDMGHNARIVWQHLHRETEQNLSTELDLH